MNVTTAEHIPNELWLRIFSYLKNADLLYAFNLLNERFERMMISYTNDIDLSNVSSKQFHALNKDTLSSEEEYHISSLGVAHLLYFLKK